MDRKFSILLLPVIMASLLSACHEIPVPRPRGYFRIELPEKEYIKYTDQRNSNARIPVSFEYPVYGEINYESEDITAPGWINIDFPAYKARIYLTYKEVDGNLESMMEQAYKLNVKNHIIKADAISESMIINEDQKVFGILYELKGNTATAVQFFVTDSIRHYLRGSLYFSAEPNPDSLAPVIDFFRKDIDHLIETLEWKEV